MGNFKEDVIRLEKANRRLEEIRAGNCKEEFEAKAEEIYPQELRQRHIKELRAKCLKLSE